MVRFGTHLQHDTLVNGELGDDVREEQVTVVLGQRVDAVLRQQTRPRERHQTTQLVALLPVSASRQNKTKNETIKKALTSVRTF